jgi:hypothetical protein
MNPSRVWRRCDPSSFKISGFLVNAGFMPHPSPSPETEQNDIEVVCQIKNMFANIKKLVHGAMLRSKICLQVCKN